MKRFLTVVVMLLCLMTVSADGVYIVSNDYNAWPWNKYDESCGDAIALYMEYGGQKAMITWFGVYGTYKKAFDYAVKINTEDKEKGFHSSKGIEWTFKISPEEDVKMLRALKKDVNAAAQTIAKFKGYTIKDLVYDGGSSEDYWNWINGRSRNDPDAHPALTDDGRILTLSSSSQAMATFSFNPVMLNKVVKQGQTSLVYGGGAASKGNVQTAGKPLNVTVAITGEDRSGADEKNREGYSELKTNMTITVKNTDGNVDIDPTQKFWVTLVKFHDNGKPVEVTSAIGQQWSLNPSIISSGDGHYKIKDPSVYKISFETRWDKLYDRIGTKTVKYQYWVKYKGQVVAKSPMKSVTITNRHIFSRY